MRLLDALKDRQVKKKYGVYTNKSPCKCMLFRDALALQIASVAAMLNMQKLDSSVLYGSAETHARYSKSGSGYDSRSRGPSILAFRIAGSGICRSLNAGSGHVPLTLTFYRRSGLSTASNSVASPIFCKKKVSQARR